jgi:adenylate cyclase
MRTPPLILVVDDVPDNVEILQLRLESQDYEVITAGDGEAALAIVRDQLPDLVLLDIQMPKLDGIETVKQLKADTALPFIPVILVTARSDAKDVVAGLEAGGDDYLTKPVDQSALLARVRAMLRIKALHDTVQEQAHRLEDQAGELALWNKELETRVEAQLGEIERTGYLKRFLPQQLAELIVAQGNEGILEPHRRDIVIVFCDLRGFTSFAETGEPEEVRDLIMRSYDHLLTAETSCNFYWGSRWVHRSFDDLEQAYYLLDTAMEKLKAGEKSQIPKSKSQ